MALEEEYAQVDEVGKEIDLTVRGGGDVAGSQHVPGALRGA